MPYDSVQQAISKHPNLKKYSTKAQRAWMKSFNACCKTNDSGDESRCFKVAYSVASKIDSKRSSIDYHQYRDAIEHVAAADDDKEEDEAMNSRQYGDAIENVAVASIRLAAITANQANAILTAELRAQARHYGIDRIYNPYANNEGISFDLYGGTYGVWFDNQPEGSMTSDGMVTGEGPQVIDDAFSTTFINAVFADAQMFRDAVWEFFESVDNWVADNQQDQD